MVLGYALVVALSFYDKVKAHKTRVIGILFLAALPVAIKVAPAIIDRFLNAPRPPVSPGTMPTTPRRRWPTTTCSESGSTTIRT
jgi:hypothetical protein